MLAFSELTLNLLQSDDCCDPASCDDGIFESDEECLMCTSLGLTIDEIFMHCKNKYT